MKGTIAERIANGETAAEIGIGPAEYAGRKAVVDRYMTEAGTFDTASFLSWLATDAAGDRGGKITTATQGARPRPPIAKGCGCGKKKTPTAKQMASSLATEVGKWAKAGVKILPGRDYRTRLALCHACPEFTPAQRCRICGCFMVAKARMATTTCPKGKWPKPQPATIAEV